MPSPTRSEPVYLHSHRGFHACVDYDLLQQEPGRSGPGHLRWERWARMVYQIQRRAQLQAQVRASARSLRRFAEGSLPRTRPAALKDSMEGGTHREVIPLTTDVAHS